MRRLLYLLVLLTLGPITQAQPTFFKVKIKNISQPYPYSDVGVFNTPVGASAPAPIFPGEAYEFDFEASPGSHLSLATMFVQSNDLFYAPSERGIPLYDAAGHPVEGDLTGSLLLWDAGTERNERPGEGVNQAPRQTGPDTGDRDPRYIVRPVRDRYHYPAMEDVIGLEIIHHGGVSFTARIENRSTASTLGLRDGSTVAVPLSPGVFVVHNDRGPIFRKYRRDRGAGLEAIAEDGDPSQLFHALQSRTGLPTILAPGVYAVHGDEMPFFTAGQPDRGEGLEALAEDGSPADLAAVVAQSTTATGGAFAIPSGSRTPRPLMPGRSYEFVVASGPSGKLSFATMYVQSNDLFYAPADGGIPLFDENGHPIYGDITDQVYLWDAGTEENEMPGSGLYQAPRQSGPNSGPADPMNTVRLVNDGYHYPAVEDAIEVTVTPLRSTTFTVRVENTSNTNTLHIGNGQSVPVPLAPGFWALHAEPAPLFTPGVPDFGLGLEEIAEDGDPSVLAGNLSMKMGTPRGVFNTPVGADGPAPIFPGEAYEFQVTAAPGFRLSLATMFVQSNDLFYAPHRRGIPLFSRHGRALAGDVTRYLDLWDAGTEANEAPGVGPYQAPRQSGPNSGPEDADNLVRLVDDGYEYPADKDVIKVTIYPQGTASHLTESLPASPTLIADNPVLAPEGVGVYPNPARDVANLNINLVQESEVTILLTDISGKVLRRTFTGQLPAGPNQLSTDISDLASGFYFYNIRMKDRVETIKLIVE